MSILIAGATPAEGFELKSARFENGDSSFLSRTLVASNRKTWTLSTWLKPCCNTNAEAELLSVYAAGNDTGYMSIYREVDTLVVSGWSNRFRKTSMVFRDPAAWYHIVIVWDTPNNTAVDRCRIYVNGDKVTAWAVNYTLTQNVDGGVNQAYLHLIGKEEASTRYSSMYLAEYYFCDGLTLDPSDFAETNALTNQWQPKEPKDVKEAVAFGRNGFYLPFSNDALKTSFTDADYHVPHTSITAVGTAHTDTAVKKFGTASMQLDGNSDYLRVPDHADWSFGTGDFTIEAWVYNTTASGTQRLFSHTSHAVNGKKGWNIFLTSNSTGRFTWSTTGSDEESWNFANCMTQNTWTHFALTRTGTTLRAFKNGVMVDSTVDSDMTTIWNSSRDLLIGVFEDNDSTVSGYFAGYIDEVRISGINRYSAGFPVPTAAYTADKDTKLLLHMDGSNDGTSFTDSSWTGVGGTGHSVTVGGTVINERISSYPVTTVTAYGDAHIIGPKIGSSAIKFDGDEDFLSIPDHADWNFGSGDFTIDFWAMTSTSLWEDDAFFWIQWNASTDYAGMRIRTNGWVNLLVKVSDSYTINLDFDAVTMPLKKWFHFALVRNTTGTNRFEIYIDGVLMQTINNSTSWPDIAGAFTIGDDLFSGGKEFTGYMDEFRVSKGVARYTADFTPETTAYTADSNTKLLIHSNTTMGSTTFTDSATTGTTHSITANGAVKHIAPKIGLGMAAFDGTDDYITMPKEVMYMHTGDFTVEGWWYFTVDSSDIFFEQGTNNSSAIQIWWNNSDKIQIYLDDDGSSWSFNVAGNTTVAINTWIHVALVRHGNNIRLYINGTLDSAFAATTFTTAINHSSDLVYIAQARTGSGDMTGYVDEVRVSTVARYTANFVAPTTAFKDDKDTRVLLHMDGGGGIDPATNLPTLEGQGTYFWDASTNAIFYDSAGVPTNKSMMDIGGGTNYLKVPTSSDWNFGTDPFTLEMWMNTDSIWPASESGLIANHNGAGWQWIIDGENSASTCKFDFWATDGTEYNSEIFTINLLQWHHLAVTREGNNLYYYIDGVSAGSDTFTETMGNTVCELTAFAYRDNGAGAIRSGNFDQVRVSNSCRYPGAYTQPSAAFSSDSSTSLLLHLDGSNDGTTFTDSGNTTHTVSRTGNIVTKTGVKKYGTASGYFNGGSGNYLSVADHADFRFGTGAFTIEAWVYPVSAGGSVENMIVAKGTSSAYWMLRHEENNTQGRVRWYASQNSVTVSDIKIDLGSSGWAYDTWHHIALVSTGTIHTLYVDGVAIGGDKPTTSDWDYSGNPIVVGNNIGFTQASYGYIDDVRISKGVARYTAGYFDAPTEPFTSDANTKLLIQSDFSEGGLGADHSGNYNYFAPTNLVADDMMLDSPMNNFATWNPLWFRTGYFPTFKEGNLEATPTGSSATPCQSTIGGLQSGKWYFEFYVKAIRNDRLFMLVGVVESAREMLHIGGDVNVIDRTYYATGVKEIDGITSSYGATYEVGDIVGVALNMDDGELTFYKNNATQGVAFTDLISAMPTGGWTFCTEAATTTNTSIANFGSDSSFAGAVTAQGNQDGNSKGDFYYTPPSGFLALCSDNLANPLIELPGEHFNTVLYTGDGGTQAVTGVGFQPDFVWLKNRSSTGSNMAYDAVRGATYYLHQNENLGQTDGSNATSNLTAFGSDGFTVIYRASNVDNTNRNTHNYASWNWKAGGTPTATNSAGAGNTPTAGSVKINGSNLGSALAGSIPALELSANTTNGFSVVTWTGNQTSGATVAHGLSQAPEMLIVKGLTYVDNWTVYHSPGMGNTHGMVLNLQVGEIDSVTYWNDTTPTASVFSLGNDTQINKTSQTMLAYCFHSVEGFSKMGTYVGNGSSTDNAFIHTGFRPAWFMGKWLDGSNDWWIQDNKRKGYNITDWRLKANANTAEENEYGVDFVSNGVKIRSSSGGIGQDGRTYIYLAFAESPFKTSNAR